MDSEQFRNELDQFHGTEKYHRHVLNPRLVWTDGVLHFARQAKAFWFIDAIAVGVNGNPGPVPNVIPLDDEFAIVLLEVKDRSAMLRLYLDTDENGDYQPAFILYEEPIEFTDCPPGTWKFYLERSGDYVVLMLPNER